MKKFLIPLLAAIALPTAVNAESVWLLMNLGFWYREGGAAAAFEKIEMKDMEQCEEQAAKFMTSDTIDGTTRERGYLCVIGK